MNPAESIRDYLDRKNINYKIAGNDFAVLEECVFCSKRYKMGVNLGNSKFAPYFYKCWSCGASGKFTDAVMEIDKCDLDKAKSILGIKVLENDDSALLSEDVVRKIKEKFGNVKEENIQIDKPSVTSFFNEYDYPFLLTTELSEDIVLYLKKRGMSDDDIKKSGVMARIPDKFKLIREISKRYDLNEDEMEKLFDLVKHSSNDQTVGRQLIEGAPQRYVHGFFAIKELGRLNGRAVFPVNFNMKMIGYVARDIRPNPFVKVLNSFGLDSYGSFWNFDNAKNSKLIVITEGIFSAISCGIDRTIAFLGKGVSENNSRYELLKETMAENVCVYLDVGAGLEAKYLCLKLQAYFPDVKIVICPTVLKINGQLNKVQELKNLGIAVESYKDEHIYISYENQFVCKKAIKIAQVDFVNRHKAVEVIKRQVTDKALMARIVLLSRACNHSPELYKAIETIAKGDFLDANDFGRDINSALIDNARVFDLLSPSIQLLDKLIVKMPR